MKKILLFTCLIAGVVLLAGCGGDGNQASKNNQAGGENANQEQSKESLKDKIEKTTLQALAKMGKDMVCTYEMPEQDNMKGTIYVAHNGQKVRSENTSSGDMEYTNMIMDLDNKMMYTWTKTKNMEEVFGMKMNIENLEQYGEKAKEAQNQNSGSQNAATMGPKPQQEMDYDCKSWKADDSKFVPPTDVQFMDLSGMMEGLQQNMPETPQDMPNMPENMPTPTY